MAHRYFTSDISGSEARLAGDEAAHLTRVLRAKPGDEIVLCDGQGSDYEVRLISVSPVLVTAEVLAQRPSSGEANVAAHLYIGYAKGERLEWAIQKAVELGAVSITPFFSETTVVKPKNEEEKNVRYRRIAHEAAKQCGRGILPRVGMPLTFAEVLAQATQYDAPLFLYEKGGQPLAEAVAGAGSVALVSGPEGGFTPKEAGMAAAAGLTLIGLGPRILRCETAPITALAAVMAFTGNLC